MKYTRKQQQKLDDTKMVNWRWSDNTMAKEKGQTMMSKKRIQVSITWRPLPEWYRKNMSQMTV
jgi:hypothetical protein